MPEALVLERDPPTVWYPWCQTPRATRPGQRMVTRWASSHNNTFSFAIVAAADQQWFFQDDYYQMLDDYIALAPPGSNEAVAKPRYHGSSGATRYLNIETSTVCAGGLCIEDLFTHEVPSTDADYVDHNLDMGLIDAKWKNHMYAYNPAVVHDDESNTWETIPDRRVAYTSEKYPWLVAAYRYHNK
eukprot:gene16546-7835_t